MSAGKDMPESAATPGQVGDTERLLSLAAGAALLGAGVRLVQASAWRGGATAVAGAGLMYRGLVGRCAVYETLGRSSVAQLRLPETFTVTAHVTVRRSAAELVREARDEMNVILGTSEPVQIVAGQDPHGFSFVSGRLEGAVSVEPQAGDGAAELCLVVHVATAAGVLARPAHLLSRPLAQSYFHAALGDFRTWAETGERPAAAGAATQGSYPHRLAAMARSVLRTLGEAALAPASVPLADLQAPLAPAR